MDFGRLRHNITLGYFADAEKGNRVEILGDSSLNKENNVLAFRCITWGEAGRESVYNTITFRISTLSSEMWVPLAH